MSSFRRAVIAALLTLSVAPVLSACSGLTPVYGPGAASAQQVGLIYAKPSNRFEQIVYEDLALKLGKASGPAPTLSVDVTALSRDLTSQVDPLATTQPSIQRQEQVNAAIRLTDVNGKVLFSGMRSATADFTANSQGLATDRAETDAAVRAAHAVADTIRLTLLGILAK
jgi:LPS-assembly lipoprotein